MWSLILFVIILGAIVTVHEFGHFIFAKLSNTYVYEFSIGMGKRIFKKKSKKSETEFCLSVLPIGGYVAIAGQDRDIEEKIDLGDGKSKPVPKDRLMYNKNFFQRFAILFAGAFNNFVFAFIILFVGALIYGAATTDPVIGELQEGYPATEAGLTKGDLILELDGAKVTNWDKALMILQTSNGEEVEFKVRKEDGTEKIYNVTPLKVESDDEVSYVFGISTYVEERHGFVASFVYARDKFCSLFVSMLDSVKYLFTGRAKVSQLSGPIGIYSIVDSQAKQGLENILYLIAYLSINVGVINILPIPALDGGRIFMLIIEKIIGKPVPHENTIHTVGFMALMALILVITLFDIIKLF